MVIHDCTWGPQSQKDVRCKQMNRGNYSPIRLFDIYVYICISFIHMDHACMCVCLYVCTYSCSSWWRCTSLLCNFLKNSACQEASETTVIKHLTFLVLRFPSGLLGLHHKSSGVYWSGCITQRKKESSGREKYRRKKISKTESDIGFMMHAR